MSKTHPKRKVGIVTFTDDVCIIGDGKANNTVVSKKSLLDYDFMIKNGVACAAT